MKALTYIEHGKFALIKKPSWSSSIETKPGIGSMKANQFRDFFLYEEGESQ